MKKVIIESHIPYVPDELNDYFAIERLGPEEIAKDRVKDADALIVRTRTYCNEELLGDSRCEFVGTATIGTDHLDLEWLAGRGIKAVSAPGCNAPAVAQYVLASLSRIFADGLSGKTIGVVGVGHVGSIVARWSRQIGMRVLECDPPRARQENSSAFVSLDEIAEQADIITFHTPHICAGVDSTHHLADRAFFDSLRKKPVIINSARGPIVDTQALITALESGKVSDAVIDCWENEPNISKELLQRAIIATPHIAGYSLNGKIRATKMVVTELCRFYGARIPKFAEIPSGAAEIIDDRKIRESYNPLEDSASLKNTLTLPSDESAKVFESLRNNYQLRREV